MPPKNLASNDSITQHSSVKSQAQPGPDAGTNALKFFSMKGTLTGASWKVGMLNNLD